MQNINIDRVSVGANRRELGDIDALADSIACIGLINPITVTQDFKLIAGLHRLEACRSIGWMEIPAVVLSLNEIDTQLTEIDENLIRNELNALERGEQLKKRKDLYEAKFPETKRGGNRKSNPENQTIDSIVSFTKDVAQKAKISEANVFQSVQVATRIPEAVRDAIRHTPIADNKTELLMLSRFDNDTQTQVAAKVSSGQVETVKEALQEIASETPAPDGFKSAAQSALEHKQSPGFKWNESLYKTLVMLNSIRDLGGIVKLSEKWSVEHREQYAERCREYAQTYSDYAEQLEEQLKNGNS